MNDAQAASDRNLPGFDTSVAHNVRVWNYWLGGKDNFEADRAAGDNTHEVAHRLKPAEVIVNHVMEAVPAGRLHR